MVTPLALCYKDLYIVLYRFKVYVHWTGLVPVADGVVTLKRMIVGGVVV